LPDTECVVCGRIFKHIWPEQVHCSRSCRKRAAEIERCGQLRVGVTGPPQCEFCQAYFEAELPQQKYCSAKCQDRAGKQDQRERADLIIAKEIADRRRTAGWRQEDLARRVEIHPRYLGAIEEGRATASGALLAKIAIEVNAESAHLRRAANRSAAEGQST
jgi:ribosome-binding protein aMBF1 (putative translation factor)